MLRIVQFLAVISIGLAMVPAGAHLFELPVKIAMTQQDYFTVQQIYRGWALFGIVLMTALVANPVAAFLVRRQRVPFGLALVATLLVLANLAVFFVWTFPANVATDNWTAVPSNWETLRRQWEYSHASNAIMMFLALCCATASALSTRIDVARADTLA